MPTRVRGHARRQDRLFTPPGVRRGKLPAQLGRALRAAPRKGNSRAAVRLLPLRARRDLIEEEVARPRLRLRARLHVDVHPLASTSGAGGDGVGNRHQLRGGGGWPRTGSRGPARPRAPGGDMPAGGVAGTTRRLAVVRRVERVLPTVETLLGIV